VSETTATDPDPTKGEVIHLEASPFLCDFQPVEKGAADWPTIFTLNPSRPAFSVFNRLVRVASVIEKGTGSSKWIQYLLLYLLLKTITHTMTIVKITTVNASRSLQETILAASF
jgi:hypothetical protein